MLTATLSLALLFSGLTGLLLTHIVSANFIPETPPPGIRINSDGTVEGTKMLRRVGNVYTFSGNIYDTIVVLCDDIVLNGVGYTLHGNGDSTGVFLQNRNNVVIKNVNIKNFNVGVKSTVGDFYRTFNGSNSIVGNNITDNAHGISLSSRASTVVSDNYIANNTYGVSLYSGSVFRNNRFER